MRLSAKAEYACIAMFELAINYGEPQPARVKAVADAHGIPARFLVQILLQLKAAGLVMSIRGAAGGYQLVRSPEKISLADVVNAIDCAPTARTAPVASQQSAASQALHSVWAEMQAAEQRMLEEITLAELVHRAHRSNALSYQI
jgi:Rrf2 family cysteine metabolism transcriptional repressor